MIYLLRSSTINSNPGLIIHIWCLFSGKNSYLFLTKILPNVQLQILIFCEEVGHQLNKFQVTIKPANCNPQWERHWQSTQFANQEGSLSSQTCESRILCWTDTCDSWYVLVPSNGQSDKSLKCNCFLSWRWSIECWTMWFVTCRDLEWRKMQKFRAINKLHKDGEHHIFSISLDSNQTWTNYHLVFVLNHGLSP